MKAPGRWQKWRRSLRAVDRSPGSGWRERVSHHGFRVLIAAAGALAVVLLFPRSPLPDFALLEEGMVAQEDVIAEIPFTVEKSQEQLEEERRQAEQSVSPRFDLAPGVADSAAARVERFFAGLDSVAAAGGRRQAVRSWLQGRGLSPSAEQVDYLMSARNRAQLRSELTGAFRSLLPDGVAPSSDLQQVTAPRVVVQRSGGEDRLVDRDSVTSLGEFYDRAASLPLADSAAASVALYETMVVRFARPTLTLDRAETRQARRQARAAVAETAGEVLEDELIVAAHERVGAAEMQELRAYRDALLERSAASGEGRIVQGLGGFAYAGLLLGLFGGVLFLYRREVYESASGFLIVFGSMLLVLGAAAVVARTGASVLLIPVAFAALITGVLYDGLLGVLTTLFLTALLAGQPPFVGITAPFTAAVAGTAAAVSVQWIERRAQSWMLIAAVAGGYVLAGGTLALLRYFSLGDLAAAAGWGSVNATLSTVLAVGAVVPALENLTGITTDQTLLELSDLNRPLLRRLSREAPGTYAHSVNVANLSEAACQAIGANALLARVGVYYHDIGKMARPHYFIENQPKGRNPHDRLRPSRSAEVIREHVREGLRMAEEAGLPEAVKCFISEHHGTRKIGYFLEKAKREEPELDLDPGDFAYPGPKPQRKETAVVMLADGIESACRALQDPSPERIREVIRQIIRERIEERQLDQCPLTLRDLNRIEDQFARVLTGMYHHRIDYPSAAGGVTAEPTPPPDVRPEETPAGSGREARTGDEAAGAASASPSR